MPTSTPIFPQTIKNISVQFTSTYTANTVTSLYTGGTNGSKVECLMASNTDGTNAQTVLIYLVVSATNYLIGAVSLPVNAGDSTTAPNVNLLAGITGLPKDSNGNPYLYLAASAALEVSVGTQPAAGKVVAFTGHAGDY